MAEFKIPKLVFKKAPKIDALERYHGPLLNLSNVDNMRLIGAGGFGQVYKASFEASPNCS